MNMTSPDLIKDQSNIIKKETVLFVCTGNTCRSPMCAALFNHKYAGLTRYAISAGMSLPGNPISSNACFALREYGVPSTKNNDYEHHLSIALDEKMVRGAEIIIGVTSSHAMKLIMDYPAYASKITSFKSDIFDPYGGDEETYKFCLKKIDDALKEMFTENE